MIRAVGFDLDGLRRTGALELDRIPRPTAPQTGNEVNPNLTLYSTSESLP